MAYAMLPISKMPEMKANLFLGSGSINKMRGGDAGNEVRKAMGIVRDCAGHGLRLGVHLHAIAQWKEPGVLAAVREFVAEGVPVSLWIARDVKGNRSWSGDDVLALARNLPPHDEHTVCIDAYGGDLSDPHHEPWMRLLVDQLLDNGYVVSGEGIRDDHERWDRRVGVAAATQHFERSDADPMLYLGAGVSRMTTTRSVHMHSRLGSTKPDEPINNAIKDPAATIQQIHTLRAQRVGLVLLNDIINMTYWNDAEEQTGGVPPEEFRRTWYPEIARALGQDWGAV